MKTQILTVSLLENDRERRPSVMREIEVCEDSSLYKLAEAIVNAYGFDFDHAFGFFSRMGKDHLHSERKYELFADMAELAAEHPESKSVQRTKVPDVWKNPGDRMLFLFDYGDMWQFSVQLIGFGIAQPKGRYPRVLKKIGRTPEQYPPVDEE